MLFNAAFSYIVAVIFNGDKKPEYWTKTTTLSQVFDTRYRMMLYRVHLAICGIVVVIGIDCTGSYKLYYHTTMTTTAPH